ncbi:MAG: hypothetical protein A2W26_12605 [Acidobacteria bacterium RBG_16_64_8]|nr:MAG: hypothetical protein A2W26_12605 [Acidobacteria bacterium RBG_16_64_8]
MPWQAAGLRNPSNSARGTRDEPFDFMVPHAQAMEANAILVVRYDATNVGDSTTEVLAWGMAVVGGPHD